ncbi:MAG: NUDIX hydrolase [Ilumatobacteraceae bacterium]
MTSDVSPAPPGFYSSLPTKHVAAGCLIRDDEGRVLLVDPIYKDPWEIPGGTSEPDESPAQTCRREIREELGLDLVVGELLCVDYHHAVPGRRGDTLQFVFDGGRLGAESIGRIALPPGELKGWAWVEPDRLGDYLIPSLAERLRCCLDGPGGSLEGGTRQAPVTEPASTP